MSSAVLATTDDDLFEYAFLSPETLESGLNVIRKAFFVDEKICIAVELSKYPGAAKELEELCVRTAKDGVSIIAIEKKTGNVIGAAFNKLQVKGSNDSKFFENFASKCKYPSSKALVQFMIDADASVDLFEVCQINCLLEIMFIGVLPEYRGRGVGVKVCELSIQIAKALLNGDNVKVPVNKNEVLPIAPIPQAVSAIFTSHISQKITKKLDFTVASEISYETFIFEGKTFASRIGPKTPTTVVVYRKLINDCVNSRQF